MILALCLDDKNGMAFNGRRQSMDRLLRADLLKAAGESPLWVSPYTLAQVLDRVEGILLYRWNRTYPADQYLDFDPAAAGFRLVSTTDFSGSSHKTLTKEVYTK